MGIRGSEMMATYGRKLAVGSKSGMRIMKEVWCSQMTFSTSEDSTGEELRRHVCPPLAVSYTLSTHSSEQ